MWSRGGDSDQEEALLQLLLSIQYIFHTTINPLFFTIISKVTYNYWAFRALRGPFPSNDFSF